jgi:hypothetical protein
MATTAEAIEAIAAGTGIPHVTVERAASILRTADSDLWPTGGRGGGKSAARPKASHLNNLGLAIFVADPLNEAPDLVRRCRKLVLNPERRLTAQGMLSLNPKDWGWDQSEKQVSEILNRLVPGQILGDMTLGDMMDNLVRNLRSEDLREFARENLKDLTLLRYRFAGGTIGANLWLRDWSLSFSEPVGGLLTLMEDDWKDQRIPVAAPLDSTTMPYKLFEIMADLASDTARELGQSVSSDAADETAA